MILLPATIVRLYSVIQILGAATMRTHHGSRVVNRESKFIKSSGLTSAEDATLQQQQQQSGKSSHSGHPVAPPLSPLKPTTFSTLVDPAMPAQPSPLYRDIHPCFRVANYQKLAKGVVNPRLPPFPAPTCIYAASKIRVRALFFMHCSGHLVYYFFL